MAYIIQLRRDTALNWTTVNPILAEGEPALEVDTLKEKIGDGVTAWNDLDYKNSQPNSDTITTAVSITNATLTDGTYSQEGKVIGISNGVNAINYTINGELTTSFVLLGTGAVTFIQGAGRTLVGADLILNGIVGSTANLVSFGTTDYLQINNL